MLPMGSNRCLLFNRSTHFKVANSTASKDFQGSRRWVTPALKKPLMVDRSLA